MHTITLHGRLPALLAGGLLVAATALGGCSGAPGSTAALPTTTSPAPRVTPEATPQATATSRWNAPSQDMLPPATVAALQRTLDDWVSRHNASGVAAAIVSQTGSWAGAAGVDALGVEIGPTSVFGIGSVTKTFTAAEILLLSAQRKVDLDAAATAYVTLPFEAAGATVRQVGRMKSGFPARSDAQMNAAIAKDLTIDWSAAGVVDWARDGERAGTLGGPGVYNGVNYQVLSMIIEKVNGEPLATTVRRDLLEPGALDRVWLQVGEKPEAPTAMGSNPGGPKIADSSGYLPSRAAASTGNGAAGMAGDAPSLARWGYLLYGGLVIDPSLVAIMADGDPAAEFGYGFGTMVDTAEGAPFLGHGGDYIGYSAIMLVWTSSRTSVVVLAPEEGLSNANIVPALAVELHDLLGG